MHGNARGEKRMSDEKKSSSADILNTLGDLLKKVAAETGSVLSLIQGYFCEGEKVFKPFGLGEKRLVGKVS